MGEYVGPEVGLPDEQRLVVGWLVKSFPLAEPQEFDVPPSLLPFVLEISHAEQFVVPHFQYQCSHRPSGPPGLTQVGE